MYMVTKPRGRLSNVSVVNTDTSASVIIGRPTIPMLDLLMKEGYTTVPDEGKTISLTEEWNCEVSKETADTLAAKALSMKKPPRFKKDATTEQKPTHKSGKQPVDVFNMIFGIED